MGTHLNTVDKQTISTGRACILTIKYDIGAKAQIGRQQGMNAGDKGTDNAQISITTAPQGTGLERYF